MQTYTPTECDEKARHFMANNNLQEALLWINRGLGVTYGYMCRQRFHDLERQISKMQAK